MRTGWRRASDVATWEALERCPDAELWEARREQRAELVEFVQERSGIDRLAERQPRAGIEAAARAFDPDVLTIGFARRNATYKRIGLLIHDPGRTLALLAGPQPVQFVLAGKAHPSDEEAKRVVQEMFRFKDAPNVAEHVVYLHEYDLGMAARLVRGCDLWLNLPRPPLEASGTSGMKAVINGGLNLSVLDGWWAEAYDGTNGWALSTARSTPTPGRRTRATPPPCTTCSSRRSCPPSMTATRTGSRAPGSPASAPRCARWLPPSAPGGCSTTTSSGSTRRRGPAPEPTHAGISDSQLLTAAATASRRSRG